MSTNTEEIARRHITYLPEYTVVICRKCKYALHPSKRSIREHFRIVHKAISGEVRKAIVKYTNQLLLSTVEEVSLLSKDITKRIEGLELCNGYECNACGYLCKGRRTMELHCYGLHDYVLSKGVQWRHRYIQTFFPNRECKYFSVKVDSHDDCDKLDSEIDDGDLYDENATSSLDRLLEASLKETEQREEERRRSVNTVLDESFLVKMTPWLRRTRWPKMFKGRDMETLVNAIRPPDDIEQGLRLIWESVARVIKRCIEGVNDVEDRAWDLIPFWLNSSVLNEPDSKPFRTYITDGSVKKYTKTWQQLICFCIRALNEEDTHGIQFQSNQRTGFEELRGMTELDPEDAVALDLKMMSMFTSLIKQSEWHTRSPIRYFCGVIGYNLVSSQWRLPINYTPILAGVQYCIRVIMLEHALPQDERRYYWKNNRKDPLERFREMRDEWLVAGKPSPFRYVHSLMNYGMGSAKNSGGRDRARWSADNKRLYFDGRVLEMCRWKKFVLELLDEAEKILKENLLFDRQQPYRREYVDDPNVCGVGYYFIDKIHQGRRQGRRHVLADLRKHAKFEKLMVVEGDHISYDAEEVCEYEGHIRRFQELLILLFNVSCGLSGRGTEITSLTYMNTMEGNRNVVIEDNQIMFVTEYHKSMAIMDDVKVHVSGTI